MFRIQRVEYLLNDQIVILENAISNGCACDIRYFSKSFKKVVVLGVGFDMRHKNR